MMVTFVSECEKKSLSKTRRVLDAFANRIGGRTWQTVITNDGLNAVKKLLRKTASKNTAVSCHWIRSRNRSDLIWVIGNKRKFDNQGRVAVNYTENEKYTDNENQNFKTIQIIKYASTISALFHDFGKANKLFQIKIDPIKKTNISEPYRHEWISLRLFQGFVGKMTDSQWLDELTQIDNKHFTEYFRDGIDGGVEDNHPFLNLPPFAQLVAWLILTHHRLPIYPNWKEKLDPDLKSIDQWASKNFDAIWNSHNCKDEDKVELIKENWIFNDLPVKSIQWRSKVCIVASEARIRLKLFLKNDTNWLKDQLFTTHIARLCLILADHHYSAQEKVTDEWRSSNYTVFANSDRETKKLKQQLDEHHIGVAFHAQQIVKALPKLNSTMNQLEINSRLNENVEDKFKKKFGWQDNARKLAYNLGKDSIEQGFFGINMASTGKGKTLANAKIMSSIGRESGRIRFSVALGLRTLTLQTGREYRKQLDLSDTDLAVLVGGNEFRTLFENNNNENEGIIPSNENEKFGSESVEDLIDPALYVDYEGDIYNNNLSKWIKHNSRLDKLIQTPVLVCTIDHLVPATEGTRGGKQIGPMLRLLTSDLVLDEPDDFGLEDLPALCRLVHWAAMLGSRILISTATMPPALCFALFRAYQEGWCQYAKANIENWDGEIVCAWFDEFSSVGGKHKIFDSFKKAHNDFVLKRTKFINEIQIHKQLGNIISVSREDNESISYSLAKVIHFNINVLHKNHHQRKNGKNISIGLVRMANINPLVSVVKETLKLDAFDDTIIHYCTYHSRYPLAIRSYLESKLDEILDRKNENKVFTEGSIKETLEKYPESNHIFVVFASPVAEVGRDHDYDWAIVEPSSMRSIIQIGGRVLRHRDKIPKLPNIFLLNNNIKALSKKEICFDKPGFESSSLKMFKHDLQNILSKNQYQKINSIHKINLPNEYQKNKDNLFLNLAELEHKALAQQLFTGDGPANIWWENNPHWCGEVQRQQKFRNSTNDEAYHLWLSDNNSNHFWRWKNENVKPSKFGRGSLVINNELELEKGKGIQFWFNLESTKVYSEISNSMGINLDEVSSLFGEVRLVDYGSTQKEYKYHPNLGLYNDWR